MRGVVAAWNRFWFDPVATSTLALVRIAFGVVALLWTLSLAPDLRTFFTADGIAPTAPTIRFWYGILQGGADWTVVVSLYVALLVGCVALIMGWQTRLASLLVFVGILSFERRTPNVFNSGDSLVRNLALYLALAPAGVAFSIDSWRRARDHFWTFPSRAPWALRLMQVQLSVMYLTTVWAKVRGVDWNNGTAVSYGLRLDDLVRFHPPGFLLTSSAWSNALTWGTLAVELSLGLLVWNRRLRPWVLLAGVALHVSIELTLHVGFFSLAMLVLYLAFVPPETATLVLRVLAAGLARVPFPTRRLGASVRASSGTSDAVAEQAPMSEAPHEPVTVGRQR